MRLNCVLPLANRVAILASATLLLVACQQATTVEAPAASPSPLADTRATATLLPTYTQPVLGAGVPPSPPPVGPGGAGIVGAPGGGGPPAGPPPPGGAGAGGGA